MGDETLKRRFSSHFPPNFETEILPQGLRPEKIEVYRVCTTGTICKDTFMSSHEEVLFRGKPKPPPWKAKRDPAGMFSVSCNDTLEGALNPLKCLRRKAYPEAFLIHGMASSEFGPMQRTKDRVPDYDDETHWDWWVYADVDPSPGFTRVDIPETVLV